MKHLHKDYHTSWCGLDASHELMTFVPSEADCEACVTAYDTDKAQSMSADAVATARAAEEEQAGAQQLAAREEAMRKVSKEEGAVE